PIGRLSKPGAAPSGGEDLRWLDGRPVRAAELARYVPELEWPLTCPETVAFLPTDPAALADPDAAFAHWTDVALRLADRAAGPVALAPTLSRMAWAARRAEADRPRPVRAPADMAARIALALGEPVATRVSPTLRHAMTALGLVGGRRPEAPLAGVLQRRAMMTGADPVWALAPFSPIEGWTGQDGALRDRRSAARITGACAEMIARHLVPGLSAPEATARALRAAAALAALAPAHDGSVGVQACRAARLRGEVTARLIDASVPLPAP
ncbi:MAG: hypothetical protein ACU0CO_15575, partial [Shimia sp.]